MFQDKCLKLKANGTVDKVPRIYVQTENYIYTFKNNRRNRYYHIKDVGALILSTQTKTDLMIFFYNSDDLHIRSTNPDELMSMLTLRFFHFNRNYTLRIYAVTDKQLSVFQQTNDQQNKMAGVYDFPDDSTRLKDREIKGEDEYNEELRKKREGNADNNIFEGLADSDEDEDEAKEGVGELPGAGGYKGKAKKDIKDVSFTLITSAFC
jgi:hypothetical protein